MGSFLKPSWGQHEKRLSNWDKGNQRLGFRPSRVVLQIYFGKFATLFKPIKSTDGPF